MPRAGGERSLGLCRVRGWLAEQVRRLPTPSELRPPVAAPDPRLVVLLAVWCLVGAIQGARLALAAFLEALESGSALELFLLVFLPLAALAIVGLLAAEWYHSRPRRR